MKIIIYKESEECYMKYTEKDLESYASPIGKTEEEKCKNAIRMVRDAMKYIGYSDDGKEIRTLTDDTFAFASDMRSANKNITLLTQGSYANKTNIPKQSDVDVAVILESTFTYKLREGLTRERYGFTEGTFTAQGLKDEVEDALKKYYKQGVERHDKSIKVYGNSYRVDADVVPAYRYRDYSDDYFFNINNFKKAIEIRLDSGGRIINYPEQHIELGRVKNKETDYRYKRIVRIVKNLKEDMKDNRIPVSSNVSSFGVESLLWNVDVSVYNKYTSLRFILDEVVGFLNGDINNFCNYLEANGIKRLFQNETMRQSYCSFVKNLADFLEY